MRLNRTDYYTNDGVFVFVVDMTGVTLTAEMIANITKDNDWVIFYNFACSIRNGP